MVVHTKESLENHTVQELKDICGEKGLKKKGIKKDLIERILKSTQRKERWKGFSFFKGTDTSAASSSKWNPFKSKAISRPLLPALDEDDTNRAIEAASIQDQQKKVPLMMKISQTFDNGVKSLKQKASKRFSHQSAAQQGSSITAAGSSKKPSIDVVILSSELDELDIAEEPQSETMIPIEQPTMPSAGPSTASTLFPGFTAVQIRKGKFKKGLMDVEAMPDELMDDVARGLSVNAFEEQSSGYESGYWDSENEYWPRRKIEVSDYLMEKTDEKKFTKKIQTEAMKRESSDSDVEANIIVRRRMNTRRIQSDSSSSDTDADDAPPPLPVAVPAPVIPPAQLFTLPCNSAGRNYIADVPYELFKTALSSKKACLDPAPVIGLDGRATHLSFQIASWETMWNGLNKKTRADHEVAVGAKMEKDNLKRKEIEDSGTPCCGITLHYWYSLACLYGRKTNIATTGIDSTVTSGLQRKCRGCFYISIAADTLEELIKPHLKEHYATNKHKWLGRVDTEEHILFDKREPGLFKEEYSGDGIIALSSKLYFCFGSNGDKFSSKVELSILKEGFEAEYNALYISEKRRTIKEIL